MKTGADLVAVMPPNIRTHKAAQTVWTNGYRAHHESLPKANCPYKGHRWTTLWLRGWNYASYELLMASHLTSTT